ncbi:fatty-acid--CoA ligase [Campylobacter sp. CCUG 57310]|uniref:fatty-acid--CoA ligase n=1 Tax=Campylobacter sp. CCUG 57310 TaxID=2517362 RepID=UPI0015669150|nr:fatty-acid--CoA ligase [Campylobacter sp. CCUG 57310]QKF91841.1 hypothetical protein CORI_0619 [Campylobacter sp. CCUG 57310]
MDTKSIVIISLIIAVAAVIAILLLIIFKLRRTPQSRPKVSSEPALKTDENINLNSLLDIVANKSSTKDELFGALKIFTDKFSIPAKQKGKIPNEAKAYLSFILLLASHSNADAKLIAFMNNELKKKNPTYANEIELYEEQGKARRRK